MLKILFGAKAQGIVGVIFLVAVAVQWFYFTAIAPPTVNAVFHVSMEALLFAAYSVIATALGYRATERVEAHVVENIENADEVNING